MGTIIKALENSKRLVIFPRLIKHNEHRNEHQYHTAKSLEKLGLVNAAFSEEDLLAYLNDTRILLLTSSSLHGLRFAV